MEHWSTGQSVWNMLFKKKPPIKVVEVLKPWAKLAMALIVVVDGVVVCNNKHGKINHEFVEMLEDIDFFLEYPWGREEFEETLSRFGLQDTEKPIRDLKTRLYQQTRACYGFPLALQLQAFKCIPELLAKIPNRNDERTFVERRYLQLSTVRMVSEEEMNNVEKGSEVRVAHTVFNPQLGNDYRWGK